MTLNEALEHSRDMSKLKRAARQVRNGTPTHGEVSLCASCRYAMNVKGQTLGEEITRCSRLAGDFGSGIIRFRVSACTEYDNKANTSLYEMKQIAWEVRPQGGNKIGFLSPADIRKEKAGEAVAPSPGRDDDVLWDPIKKETV